MSNVENGFVDNLERTRDLPEIIIGQFVTACEEALICLSMATQGLEMIGEEIKRNETAPGQRMWIGSNVIQAPRYHASISVPLFLTKAEPDGAFTSEMGKAFLCMLYAQWEEACRPTLAKVMRCEPGNIRAPLMGDLRKIRHCILHNKSRISENGLGLEVLPWRVAASELVVTRDLFRDFVDAVRAPMVVQTCELSPEAAALREKMTVKERQRFDA
jgi:hypothetical protein